MGINNSSSLLVKWSAASLAMLLAVPLQAALPDLPLVWLDTTYVPAPCTVNVPAGGNLQAALNNPAPGAVICLQAGATFSGGFTISKKNANWVTVRTATPDAQFVAPGTRVGPANAPLMAKLVTTGGNAPVLNILPGSAFWRFIGLEMTQTANSGQINGLVRIANFGGYATTLAQVPTDFTFDRCYIHGDPAGSVKIGIAMHSARTAVIDSYISDIHLVGQDAQAVGGANGQGPFKIVNNFLEASGENLIFGGLDPVIPNMIASDMEIRHNYFYKPLTWYHLHPSFAGIHWSIKNLLELKNGRRVLIDGNIFENNWGDAQTGTALNFKSCDQDGFEPWAVVEHVTFTHNLIRHSGSAFVIVAQEGVTTQFTNHILIQDNLFDDINGTTWNGDGDFARLFGPLQDVTINHNTAFNSGAGGSFGSIDMSGNPPGTVETNFVFTNNIVENSVYGWKGAGTAAGNATLNAFMPGYSFTKNIIEIANPAGMAALYPPGNFFPNFAQIGFANFNAGNGGDYHLVGSSPYKSAGTDGKDIGADIDALNLALTGVYVPPPGSGNGPPGTQANTPRWTVKVFPNPWRKDRHAGAPLSFTGMPDGSTVKVFTVSGHKVKSLTASATGATWDRTTESGGQAASGVYIYLVTDSQGNQARGKFALIH